MLTYLAWRFDLATPQVWVKHLTTVLPSCHNYTNNNDVTVNLK